MGEDPVPAPELAHERMAVFQQHCALRRLADMGNDVLRLDRITLDQLGHRRGAGRLVVDEQPAGLVLEERHAETVGMVVGHAATGGKAREGERHVGWRGAVHA
ncbi:hypothetical protein D3C72_2024180 [compost metagenome]